MGLVFGSCLMCVAYLIFSPLSLLNIYHYVCMHVCMHVRAFRKRLQYH